MSPKITKFPSYIGQNFRGESPDISIDSTEKQTIALMFWAEQSFDFTEGIRYAEEAFLARDIRTFTALELEIFIKEAHKRIAYNLLLMNRHGTRAGEYSEARIAYSAVSGRSVVPELTGRPFHS